jgi:hypothetical protein
LNDLPEAYDLPPVTCPFLPGKLFPAYDFLEASNVWVAACRCQVAQNNVIRKNTSISVMAACLHQD